MARRNVGRVNLPRYYLNPATDTPHGFTWEVVDRTTRTVHRFIERMSDDCNRPQLKGYITRLNRKDAEAKKVG